MCQKELKTIFPCFSSNIKYECYFYIEMLFVVVDIFYYLKLIEKIVIVNILFFPLHLVWDFKIDNEVRDRKHDVDDWVNVVW